MAEFGGLIRDAREKLGMSPHRVGELIGRAAGTVKAWERGRTIPNDPVVVSSLAAVLAIDERVLFEAANLNPPDHRHALTIEQELATIAPPSRPVRSPEDAKPEPPPQERPAQDRPAQERAAQERPAQHQRLSSDTTAETAETEPAEVPAIAELVQKGVDAIAEAGAAISEAGAPLLKKLRTRRERPRPQPRAIPTPPPPVPTGSYMEDPEERWSYRLRAVWTAAGVGALGVLLLWAGSRALDAFGETWDALLAGL